MSGTTEIWFGTRAVRLDGAGPATGTSHQHEVISQDSQFQTNSFNGINDVGISQTHLHQLLAFVGTAAARDELGVNLADGVDTALAGQVNTTGDLRVGSGVLGYNIEDVLGGNRTSNVSSLDQSDDPVRVSGFGKGNAATLLGSTETAGSATPTGNFVTFSNALGFGFAALSGAEVVSNAPRINDGDSVNFEVGGGSQLKLASFTVRVLNGGTTAVVIDSDGRTIRDENGAAQGGFVQDASSGELNLGMLADGAKVVINYVTQSITIDGAAFLGSKTAYFQAFSLAGQNDLTIGSQVVSALGLVNTSALPGGLGFSVDNLVLSVAADGGPDGAGDDPFLDGTPVLSFDLFSAPDDAAPEGLLNLRLYAYFDGDGSNTLDLAEVPSAQNLGRLTSGNAATNDPSGDGDDNPVQGLPGASGISWVTIYALGQVNNSAFAAPANVQYGEHITGNADAVLGGSFALSVDTARNSADISEGGADGSPGDIDPGTSTFHDSPGSHVELGEVLGFVLTHQPALAARITYGDAFDFSPDSAEDIIVRLYKEGTLVQTTTHDVLATGTAGTSPSSVSTYSPGMGESGSIVVTLDPGFDFDRIEIQAAGSVTLVPGPGNVIEDAGARFVLTDLDFILADYILA